MYDSTFSVVADATAKVIENLFNASVVEVVKSQKQNGSQDYRLSPIATTTALLNDVNVSELVFIQSKMRNHLLLFQQEYDSFPRTSKNLLPVYCIHISLIQSYIQLHVLKQT